MKNRYKGIIFITVSAFFFALMNLFVKLSGNLPTMQKAFFRNFVAAIIALVMLLARPAQFRTIKGNVFSLVMRSVAGTLGVILNFYAIDSINIADASILNKLSPFFAILFSWVILCEKPSKFEFLAVLIAFVGAGFVVRPTFSVEVLPAFGGVLGGMMAGLAYTYVRRAGSNGAARNLIVFFFSAFSCIVILPFMIIGYKHMEWWQILYLLGAGGSAAGGQMFITRAYTYAPAKEISVFDYSIVIFTTVLGMIFLSEFPDALSYVGYVIIIGGAAVNWVYQKYKEKHGKADADKIKERVSAESDALGGEKKDG